MTFETGSGHTNIARCRPSRVTLGGGGTCVFNGVGGNTPVNFVAFIRVKASYLIKPLPANSTGHYTKKVDGFMLGGEFTRSACLPGMVLNVTNYVAPVGLGYCSFGGDWKSMKGECLHRPAESIFLMFIIVQMRPRPPELDRHLRNAVWTNFRTPVALPHLKTTNKATYSRSPGMMVCLTFITWTARLPLLVHSRSPHL